MAAPRSIVPAPGLIVIVMAVMAGVYLVDKVLARQEQIELLQEARSRYAEGQALMNSGKSRQAVEKFQRAHALQRSNIDYELALAEAELAASDLPGARDAVENALDSNSNGGPANLLMARILVKEDRFQEADSFYHRAIYGEWPANGKWPANGVPSNKAPNPSLRNAARARLELVHLLARRGSRPELLSELLLLENEPGLDPDTLRAIAGMFVDAGSPARGAEVYQELIRKDPEDVNAYAGLGRAEILRGNYRAAAAAFFDAVRRSPYDARLGAELHMVSSLAALDPTSRRLSSAEKFRRSEDLLRRVQARGDACLQSGKAPAGLTAMLDKSQQLTQETTKGPVTNEMAEVRLDMAEKLWAAAGSACQSSADPGDPVPVLMQKLTQ